MEIFSKNKIKSKTNELMRHAIMLQARTFLFRPAFKVDAFTCLTLRNEDDADTSSPIFRCTEDYRGKPWYDWCMVSFLSGNEYKLNPSKLLGFLKYDSSGGVPTKGLMEGYEGSITCKLTRMINIFDQNIVDPTVYAVVHCTKEEMTMNDLINSFVKKVEFGDDVDEFVYIVEATSIYCPLFCIPDLGGTDGKVHYIAPSHDDWGKFFSKQITLRNND